MKIITIVPAYNEEKTIKEVIQGVKRSIKSEVIVIDDGSKDNTKEIAKKYADYVISFKQNKGLGITFKEGINKALKRNPDIIVNIDADGQFNPEDIPKLTKPIEEKRADMVTCTRFFKKKLTPKMPWIKKFGNYSFTKLINLLTHKRFTDTQCGFRAYSKEATLRLNLFGKYTYTQEVFLDLINKDLIIKEIPLKVRGERKGKSRLVKNVFIYGLKCLLIIIRAIRDHQPLKFFGLIGIIFILLGIIAVIIRLILNVISSWSILLIFIFGLLLIILGLIADMFERQRKLMEEILYKLKKKN